MRWPTHREKLKSKLKIPDWHRWYAWHPVVCEGMWVWLETIYRKGELVEGGYGPFITWQYRLKNNLGVTS
jgi:hypothetical protein